MSDGDVWYMCLHQCISCSYCQHPLSFDIIQGVYKLNQANFQGDPGGILRKIQDMFDMFALLQPSSEGTPRVSPLELNRDLGERHKLPHRGLGQSPGWKRVLVHLELERTHLMAINFVFLRQIFIHIFMTDNQCGRFSTSCTKISWRTN